MGEMLMMVGQVVWGVMMKVATPLNAGILATLLLLIARVRYLLRPESKTEPGYRVAMGNRAWSGHV